MSALLEWSLLFARACLTLAMVFALARLLRGPSAQDRVMALDSVTTSGLLLMLTLGLSYRSSMYFEGALLLSVFGFVSSTALAKFLLRGEVIE